jgi:phage terminase large subunit
MLSSNEIALKLKELTELALYYKEYRANLKSWFYDNHKTMTEKKIKKMIEEIQKTSELIASVEAEKKSILLLKEYVTKISAY